MRNSSIFLILMIFISFINQIYGQDQIKKGIYRASGSFGLSLSNENHDYIKIEETDFQLTASYSYLIFNFLEAGGTISYLYSEEMEEAKFFSIYPNYKYEEYFSSLDIGPNLRFYFSSKGIIPFIETSILYSISGKQGGMKHEEAIYTIGTGFDYFIKDGLAIEPFVNYTHLVYKGNARNSIIFGGRINYFVF